MISVSKRKRKRKTENGNGSPLMRIHTIDAHIVIMMNKNSRQIFAGSKNRKSKGNYIIYGVVYLMLLTTIALIVVVKQLPQVDLSHFF